MSLNDVVPVPVRMPFLLSARIQPHVIVRERAVRSVIEAADTPGKF